MRIKALIFLKICVCALIKKLRSQAIDTIIFNTLIDHRFASQFNFSIWSIVNYYTIKNYRSENCDRF